MATNAEKTKLFVDRSDPNNPKGITLAEMMQVLGYYKRDKNGKRNLGMIYTNAEIKSIPKTSHFLTKHFTLKQARRGMPQGKASQILQESAKP